MNQRKTIGYRRSLFSVGLFCLSLLFLFSSPVRAASDVTISDVRTLHIQQKIEENDARTLQLVVNAFDRTFTLNLQENEKLVASLGRVKGQDPTLFSGHIEGLDGSWVRVTRNRGKFTGAFFDGTELFMIDSRDMVSDSLPYQAMQQQLQDKHTDRVVYKASDVESTATCGMSGMTNGHSGFNYQSLVNELSERVAMAAGATSQLDVVIVADTEYVATSSGDTVGQVLSQMNVVDGIFSEQVGVQFRITDIIALANNGSLNSIGAESLLISFRSYINSQVGNPGLAHLFTGKDLSGNIIGIAYLNALCSTFGVGLTQAGGRGLFGALTAAHEFGHNFGAPHDNQSGSACVYESGNYLMNPVLNGSDQFSQCSLEHMALEVNSASCIADISAPQPPQIISSPNTNAAVGVPYAYDTNSTLEAIGLAPISFNLDSGPVGMQVNSSGVVTWTPQATGVETVHITAINSAGSDSQGFDINVLPAPQYPPLNFNDFNLVSYGENQDVSGTVNIEDAGLTVRLEGNRWQAIPINYTVTPNTVVELDFRSSTQGEIHGFGLDQNLALSLDKLFSFYGFQNLPPEIIENFHTYPGGGIAHHYVVPVGQFYTGFMQYMFFVMDHDAGGSSDSLFSNIRIYEAVSAPTAPEITSTPNTTAFMGLPYAYDADSSLEVTGTTPVSFSLNIAPAGMTISAAGVVNWIPQPGQEGVNNVEIEVSNVAGTDIQSFNIMVTEAGAGLNFNDYSVSTYVASEDQSGSVTIEDGGATLRLVGNRWQKIDFPYTVTPDTVIEFDFRSSAQGEIHGIGLDNDLALSPERTFRVYGTQSWGNGTYDNYPGSGVMQHYVIPVGQFYTGDMQYLFFAMDHDVGATGESLFSNIQVYENSPEPVAPQITSTANTNATVGSPYSYDADNTLEVTGTQPITFSLTTAPPGMTVSSGGVISWTPQANQVGANAVEVQVSNAAGSDSQSFSVTVAEAPVIPGINFVNNPPSTYVASEDQSGSVTIEDGGATLHLVGNRWQKIDFPYTVTPDTVIEFDFRSSAQGEIHGIGLDNDLFLSPERTFRVYGTQSWGNGNYDNYPGGGIVQHYVIPVGQFYTGDMQYLFFAMDHDAGATGESLFTNVQVYENTPAPVAPQITSTPNTNATVGSAYSYDANNNLEATGTQPITFALTTAPAGMTVSSGGAVNWTPQAGQLGANNVVIQASNAAGSDTQSFSVTVIEAPVIPGINFNNNPPSTYVASEDQAGTVTVEDGGATLHLVGNRWQKIDFPYTVTPETVIEFDFRSSAQGEIHGIGLDNDLFLNPERTFRVYGTQSWGNGNYDNYPGGGVVQHYVIPVGQFYTGNMQYLFFAMDHDAGATGESLFTNVQVYENTPAPVAPQITSTANTNATVGSPYSYDTNNIVEATGTAPISYGLNVAPAGMTISAGGAISWTPQANQVGANTVEVQVSNVAGIDTQTFDIMVVAAGAALNFNEYTVSTYVASEDQAGTVTVEDNGATLHLEGNRWQKIDFPYTVTPDTVIEFDFRSSAQGEIHGIGLDTDLAVSSSRTFRVYGTQSWGNGNYDNYPGGGVTRHYVIPVGQFYTGSMQYLFFVMDHDAGATGNSFFTNVRVYEP